MTQGVQAFTSVALFNPPDGGALAADAFGDHGGVQPLGPQEQDARAGGDQVTGVAGAQVPLENLDVLGDQDEGLRVRSAHGRLRSPKKGEEEREERREKKTSEGSDNFIDRRSRPA